METNWKVKMKSSGKTKKQTIDILDEIQKRYKETKEQQVLVVDKDFWAFYEPVLYDNVVKYCTRDMLYVHVTDLHDECAAFIVSREYFNNTFGLDTK